MKKATKKGLKKASKATAKKNPKKKSTSKASKKVNKKPTKKKTTKKAVKKTIKKSTKQKAVNKKKASKKSPVTKKAKINKVKKVELNNEIKEEIQILSTSGLTDEYGNWNGSTRSDDEINNTEDPEERQLMEKIDSLQEEIKRARENHEDPTDISNLVIEMNRLRNELADLKDRNFGGSV